MENIFSHQGHLRGYYRDATAERDFVPGGQFVLEIGDCRYVPEKPREEAIRAARLIAATAQEPIWLCLSGGVDSECMALAFLAAGIPFQVAILRFAGKLNWFDIKHAVRFCRKRRLPFRFFDLDLDAFFAAQRHLEYAHRYRCVSPQLAAHLYLLEQIPGFPVLSWNAPAIEVGATGIRFGFPGDLYFCYQRFLQTVGKPGVAFFFLYTPELIYSFLREPRLQDVIFQRVPAPTDAYRLKCQVYREGGFEVRPRANKFTGFEQVKVHYRKRFREDERAFDRHFRWPLEQLYPRSDDVAIRLSKRDLLVVPERQKPGVAQAGEINLLLKF